MKILRSLFLALLLIFFVGCQQLEDLENEEITGQSTEASDVETQAKEEEIVVETQKQETTITIGAIGDILLHERVYAPAKTSDGSYDFLPMLQRVAALLEAPDFLMANMESIPGGVELGLSTYPSFNSPHEIVSNLQTLGVDMLVGANNHTLDRGLRAVESAIDFYEEIGMAYVGKYRSSEDRDTDRIVTVEDISIGVLAYSYGTNGIPVPKGHEYVVALIDSEKIAKDVKKLREKVDILVVHMHWGAEYEREPNQEQRELALQLAEAGVDVVFGHHPHVLQPIEALKLENGHETVVFYSLGNFFSGQNFDYTDIGGVATVKVTKTVEDDHVSVKIHSPEIEPTQVVQQENGYFVRPMKEAETPSISGATLNEIIEHTQVYITK
ncbi:MAG: CapA family protein [Anaerobacillus sp.]|uniref:CapA family protein n=1 Tax=Anaerobacillus sp. TaxID=1872506 RepID=UPI00391AA609